jgi:hypothetical protein
MTCSLVLTAKPLSLRLLASHSLYHFPEMAHVDSHVAICINKILSDSRTSAM